MSRTQAADRLPFWIYTPAACAAFFLLIPFGGLLVRIEWTNFSSLFHEALSSQALTLSLTTCAISTAICAVFGVPLAVMFARFPDSLFTKIFRPLSTLPMVLPPVVAGLTLLITWGRRGLLGEYLHILGLDISFTTAAVVVAQVFVSMPFLITSFEGSLRTRGFSYEATAHSLGASPGRIFTKITLPLSFPALLSATALSFSRALGEFGATITFAGSLRGVTRTLPLEIYLQREESTESALMLSVLLIVTALGVALVASSVSQRWHSNLFVSQPQSSSSSDRSSSRSASPADEAEGSAAETASPQVDFASSPTEHPPLIRAHVVIPERAVDASFTFTPSSATALMGENGSGKSSVLSVISGALPSPKSTLSYEGGEARIATLSQNPILFPHMSAEENVAFPLVCAGAPRAQAVERAREQMAAVGTDHLARRRPTHMSGGQRQRTAIARALVTEPTVVLLDEPMSALDVQGAAHIRSLIARCFSGATIIMATHDLADVAAFDARVILLRGGKIVREGSWSETAAALSSDELASFAAQSYLQSLYSMPAQEEQES